jgi:hypothetical protein
LAAYLTYSVARYRSREQDLIDPLQSPKPSTVDGRLVNYPSSSSCSSDSSDDGSESSDEYTNASFDINASRPSQRDKLPRRSPSPTPTEKAKFHERTRRRGNHAADLALSAHTRVLSTRTTASEKRLWTKEETGALYTYIVDYGTSWANIKRLDNKQKYGVSFLTDRSQVNLKDKARNMKFLMLKAGFTPPKNFGSITLTAAMKAKLDGMGISY